MGISPEQVDLTVDEFEEDNLGILDDGEDDTVGIGELIALCVDLPIIGIPLVDNALAPIPVGTHAEILGSPGLRMRFALVVLSRKASYVASGLYLGWNLDRMCLG